MKRIITILAVLAVFAGSSFAGSNISAAKMKMAEKNYKNALTSDNAGVRNSALYNIVVLKSVAPELKANAYKKALTKIANSKEEKPYIRVNAKMTLVILNNELPVKDLNKTDDPNEFFNSVYAKLTDMYAAR